jgi:hypothetical protein
MGAAILTHCKLCAPGRRLAVQRDMPGKCVGVGEQQGSDWTNINVQAEDTASLGLARNRLP